VKSTRIYKIGTGWAIVAATVAVIVIGGGLPSNTVAPVASGTAEVGETLTCSTGTWTESPTSYAYKWQRDNVDISGQTASTKLLVSADAETNVRCGVAATNAEGTSAYVYSAARAIPIEDVGGGGCDSTLSAGANIATAISGAAAGSTICLNDGTYAAFSLPTTTKSPRVTVRAAAPPGVNIGAINVASATPNGINIEDVTVTGNSSWGTSNQARNITLRRVDFGTNQLDMRTNLYNAQNILLDDVHFGTFDESGGQEGRLSILYAGGPGANPSGVTVTNSLFDGGGCSDGIQLGGRGVTIGPGNVFTGLVQGGCSTHVDSMQGYGDAATVVKGNFFIGNTVDLGWYDGGSGHTFEDNVLASSGGVNSFRGLSNTIIRHNTFYRSAFRIEGKTGNPSAMTIQYNLFDNWSLVGSTACTSCAISNNMFDSGAFGTSNVSGNPVYVGGGTPSTYEGYKLATGSTGKGAADAGSDMGARIP
jgi:hypothetical protein